MTRLDISFVVNKLSQFLQAPIVSHWNAFKCILRYLASLFELGLHFKVATRLNLEMYFDADWASTPDDRRSTSGYCAFLGGHLLNWSSSKQKVVLKSTAESEYRVVASATAAKLLWLQSLFTELGITIE